jgi:MEDS: MEthanogen/methylotroph, DcmR Sensory domain/Histidine kinase-like ATPase domain
MSAETQDVASGMRPHVVQFYEHDPELVDAVVPYLAAGVKAAETTIVIATEAHLRAFAAGLAACGVDAPQGSNGGVIALDAASTLAALKIDGKIDREAFAAVVAARIRRAGSGGRAVRVYGEMVALLWQAGDVLAAIKLEEMWNELAGELPFSLFCSYPAASVEGAEHTDALQQVCRLHSSVVSAGAESAGADPLSKELTGEFSGGQDAPGRARRFAVAALRRWGLDDALVGDAALVLSELATNAVLHAGSPFSIAVSSRESRLRISVQDACPRRPVEDSRGSLVARFGHGLGIIDELCIDWGVEDVRDGKAVWAELRAVSAQDVERV